MNMKIRVMDSRIGDIEHDFTAEQMADAGKVFAEFLEKGFTPAVKNQDGSARKLNEFDPTAPEVLFFPRVIGG
jgi:hypothetical protein